MNTILNQYIQTTKVMFFFIIDYIIIIITSKKLNCFIQSYFRFIRFYKKKKKLCENIDNITCRVSFEHTNSHTNIWVDPSWMIFEGTATSGYRYFDTGSEEQTIFTAFLVVCNCLQQNNQFKFTSVDITLFVYIG